MVCSLKLGWGNSLALAVTPPISVRGIDCPEIQTRDGIEAKEFVETTLKGVDYLTIKTVKSDKYDRYLGDVFVEQKNGSNLYLNNELIEKGHAVRVSE
ncbi:MAG: thermonuclease family protein [Candidatus Omnitrophota bacterium]